jgi:hypothetical protein
MSFLGHEIVFQRRGLTNLILAETKKLVLYSAIGFFVGYMNKSCSSEKINLRKEMNNYDNFNIMYQVNDNQAEAFMAYNHTIFPIPLEEAKNSSIKSLYRNYVKDSIDDKLKK